MHRSILIIFFTIFTITIFIQHPLAQNEPKSLIVSPQEITRLGVTARIDESQREAAVLQLARHLKEIGENDKPQILPLQRQFQDALLWVSDNEVLSTLSPETIEAVDDAIESVLTLSDIRDNTEWDGLAYVYGFFNHDVTAGEIQNVADEWNAMPMDERNRRYPSYIHLIDAVCKPLSVGGLAGDEETEAALKVALPLLKSMYTAPANPGTAFHEPSHAVLVLAPLYDRWSGSPKFGGLVKEQLGTREEFIELLTSRLVSAQENNENLQDFEYTFFAYVGQFTANALARMDAREAIPALQESLRIYKTKGSFRSAIPYTERALIALGDEEARKAFESGNKEQKAQTAVWLIRNGKDETSQYGRTILGEILQCPPDEELKTYYERKSM